MHKRSQTGRRRYLQRCSLGLGALAIRAWLPSETWADSTTFSPPAVHHQPRVKRVIFLFMHGGVSQVDTFDYKPRLAKDDGRDLPFDLPPNISAIPKVLNGPWKFRRRGQSGLWCSDLLPEMGRLMDDFCVIRSMHTRGQSHGQAVGMMNTGSDNLVRPSVGAWISYALGSGHPDLPAHVSIGPATAHGGPRNYGAAFLPAMHQATVIGSNGKPGDGQIAHLHGTANGNDLNRRIDLIQSMNRRHLRRSVRDAQLRGAVDALDLAQRMRSVAPEVFDLSGETAATHRDYGVGQKPTDSFGRSCLLARRLAAAGVRFISVSSGQVWDQHSKLKEGHQRNADKTDRPVAALIRDLKARGMLDDTLIIWGGEFGRTPVVQGKNGRDHNPQGFTTLLCGGGVRGGYAHGETDEYGYHAVRDRVHVHDLHATILHLLGIDHERLTFPYAGRDFRLTDVHGRVVHPILA